MSWADGIGEVVAGRGLVVDGDGLVVVPSWAVTLTLLGPADLGEGEARIHSIEGLDPPWRSVIVVQAETGWCGYWNVCRHIPVPLDGGEGHLEEGDHWTCRTHGARFRVSDGLCVEGPCQGLSLYALAVYDVNGSLWADVCPPLGVR